MPERLTKQKPKSLISLRLKNYLRTCGKTGQANLTQIEQVKGFKHQRLMSIEGVSEEEANIIIDSIKNWASTSRFAFFVLK